MQQMTPRRHTLSTSWTDWFAAHAWWTTLIAGALLCAVAVGLA
jgi:hypothetical protein